MEIKTILYLMEKCGIVFRHDLAELLIKLRQFDKSEKVMTIALDNEGNSKYSQTCLI